MKRRAPGWSPRSIWKTPSRNGRCATASTSYCAAATRRRWRRSNVQDSKANEMANGITPSQTVGPYFAYGLTPGDKYDWNDAFSNNLITPDATGERIRVE